MGPETKIEFTGGTLYFGDQLEESVSVQIHGLEVIETEEGTMQINRVPDYINKILNEPFEFEATCEIKFRGLVKLLGFWPAVKWEIGRYFRRYR